MATDFDGLSSAARLQALRDVALLDTEPDARFDRFTRLAAGALRMPVSLVSLVDENRQFFKSCTGLPDELAEERGSPLSHSVCQHVVRSREPLLIADARADAMLRDNGAVVEWGLVSYAGVPLITSDDQPIGSLCVIGFEPRVWTPEDVAQLEGLAELLMEEIEGRARTLVNDRGRDALANSLARFRSTVEGLAEGVALVRLDGRIDYVSPRLTEMTGYGWADLVGRSIERTLLAGESREGVVARLARRAAGESERYETRLVRKDGGEMAVEVGGAPLRDADGRVVGAVKTFVDITWRRHQAEVIRESEARFRAVFQNAGLGIALLGPGTRVMDGNPALHRLLGGQAVIGRALDEVAEREHRVAVRGLHARAAAAELPLRMEVALRGADGGAVWTRIVASALPAETVADPPLVLAVVEDITAERAGEAMLRERALVLEAISDAVVAVRLDGRIAAWNAGAERLCGYAEEEILGCRVDVLLAPEIRARMQGVLREMVDGEDRWMGELTVLRKDGRQRTAEASVVLRRDAGGQAVSHIAVLRDVTERKEAEAALRRSEGLLRQAQTIAGIGTWVREVSTDTLEGSEATYRLFGYAPGSVPGDLEFYLFHVHPHDRERVEAVIAEAMRTGEPFEYESRIVRADGELRYQLVRGDFQRDAEGRLLRGVGVVQDITAWRNAEDEIRRQALVFTQIADAVVVADTGGRILDCNPAAAKLAGMRREEMIGSVGGILAGVRDEDREALCRALREGGAWAGRLESSLPGGRGAVLEGTAVLQRGQHGGSTGIILVLRDVTDRIALESQLRHAQKMEAVGRLAGGIAHDFNNILMAVGGFAGILVSRAAAGTEEHAWLGEIRRGTERAAQLTGQLLAFSRKQMLRPESLDLNAAVGQLLPLLHPLLGEQVRLDVRLEAGLPDVRVDRGQLDQVIMNLAINARDAMPHGGRLSIATERVVVQAGSPLPLRPGRYACLLVQDTGEGIRPEILGQIFEPFFTTKPQGRGTGLGLATVEGILAQSEGAISVESEPGAGATFRVYLPHTAVPPADEEDGADADGAAAGPATVLVVEDDPAVLALTRLVLETEGYRVLTAQSGADAVAVVAGHSGDIRLLVSDVMMPGMTGPDLARRLRERLPELAVGLMSGYTGDTIPPELIAGFDLVAKPVSPEQLARWVAGLLDPAP